MAKKPKRPAGPKNLKKHGFTNALWRLDERDRARAKAAQKEGHNLISTPKTKTGA